MTSSEKRRCSVQVQGMETKALVELAEMMEMANDTERETLEMILVELKARGADISNLDLINRADDRGSVTTSEQV